jgi:hypothetical protein
MQKVSDWIKNELGCTGHWWWYSLKLIKIWRIPYILDIDIDLHVKHLNKRKVWPTWKIRKWRWSNYLKQYEERRLINSKESIYIGMSCHIKYMLV